MKTNKLLKLACLVIGLVMLVSAMPMSAIAPYSTGKVNAPAAASAGSINVVLRDFGKENTQPDLTAHKTSAVDFEVWSTAIAKNEASGNSVYAPNSTNKTHIKIKDLVGESLQNGFVYSADYKFGADYINGSTADDKTSDNKDNRVQFISFADWGYLTLARLGHDGKIYATMASNSPAIPGVKIEADTWFNFRVEFLVNNATSFIYYIYIDDVLVYWSTYGNANSGYVPGKKPMEYRILAGDRVSGSGAMLDNIKFRTLPIIPDPARVDTTIDFENLSAEEFTSTTWINDANLGPYLNTSKTAVSTSWTGSSKMNASIITSTNATYNRVWKNASSKAYVVVDDIENRLINHDFTVSADMMFSLFPEDKTSLIQWLRGESLNSFKTNELIYIDGSGAFMQNGVELGAKAELDKWFNVTLRISYVYHNIYNVATYIDGKLIASTEMTLSCNAGAKDGSFIRFMSTSNAKFTACMDNLQIYESDNVKIYEEKDVIWDLDFDNVANGSQLTANVWNSNSEGYQAVRSNLGSNAVIQNGKLVLKLKNNNTFIDIKIGGNNYDPLKTDTVAISLKLNMTKENTDATLINQIVRWRRVSGPIEASNGKSANILCTKGRQLLFFGMAAISEMELNKEYDIKMVIDGKKSIASLYINGEKVIDSVNAGNFLNSQGLYGEGLSYITDDAGNTYFLPYSGMVYQQKYDENGVAIEGKYEKRFVEAAGYCVDTLRLFQAANTSCDAEFLVDDFKVERIDMGNEYFSTDFTGWSKISGQNPNSTNSDNNSYLSFAAASPNNPTVVTETNGNECVAFSSEQRMFIADRKNELLYKSFEFSFDMYYTKLDNPAATGVGSFMSIIGTLDTPTPTTNITSFNQYSHFIHVDEKGNLYDNAKAALFNNIDGRWINVRVVFNGNGTRWTSFDYYLDGQLVKSTESTTSKSYKSFVIRIIPNKKFDLKLDNLSVKFISETESLNLDFDGDYEAMIATMGSEFKFPAIDSTRTDVNGGTVVSAQVLGDSDKFLRIDRTLLAADQISYVTAENGKYIGQKQYIVETDFRFTSESGHGITPLIITTDRAEMKFTPLEVRGAENTITASIRGAHYTLTDASGNPVKVNTIADDGFTKLALLVNEDALTYTVYVNGSVPYYYYDGEYLPAVNLPITYSETGLSTALGATLKILEVPSQRHNYSIIDIDRIAIIPAPSTLSSDFKATQTRVNASAQTFDLRFIAGLDSLYGNKVGFEVVATYVDGSEKTVTKDFTSNVVFSSIDNDGETVLASAFGCNYLSVMSITALPVTNSGVSFKVTPFVEYGTVRCLGEAESFVATCNGESVVIE